MPFGMKNASATYQTMVYSLNLKGCEINIDDVIIYSS